MRSEFLFSQVDREGRPKAVEVVDGNAQSVPDIVGHLVGVGLGVVSGERTARLDLPLLGVGLSEALVGPGAVQQRQDPPEELIFFAGYCHGLSA